MRPRILLFDLYTGGHHRHYLEMLARAWVRGSRPGLLEVAAPEALFDYHADFSDWLDEQDPQRVSRLPVELPDPLPEGTIGLRGVLSNDRTHGQLLSRLIAERKPDHVLAMYFDHIQASLAMRRVPGGGSRSPQTRISGVYFRPSFHFPEERPTTRLRKRLILRAALSNPAVRRVLTLDPFAAKALADRRVVWVPDGFNPMPPTGHTADIRAEWGVAPERTVLLFFGVVSSRKGIHQLLAALPRARSQERIALVIAGRIPETERQAVQASIAQARTQSDVQIVHDDRYIPEERIQDMFRTADAALVPYQRHTGSSNVLIRAAAEGVPVIGPSHGLMGRLIGHHRLGMAVNTEDPAELAAAIDRVIASGTAGADRTGAGLAAAAHTGPAAAADTGARADPDHDPAAARAFAAANTAQAFAETVFSEILDSGPPRRGGTRP
jgi:glycosyltransferase involved in cell wall biosynthesis